MGSELQLLPPAGIVDHSWPGKFVQSLTCILEEPQSGEKGPSVAICYHCRIQGRRDGGLDQGLGSGYDEKWPDTGCLKVKLKGFVAG